MYFYECIYAIKNMTTSSEKIHMSINQHFTRIDNDMYKTDMYHRVVDI
jgi:hypothetical protein